jgi:hypothetical protein
MNLRTRIIQLERRTCRSGSAKEHLRNLEIHVVPSRGKDGEPDELGEPIVALALTATLLAIWLGISTALSEIVVGTMAQLLIGAFGGSEVLGVKAPLDHLPIDQRLPGLLPGCCSYGPPKNPSPPRLTEGRRTPLASCSLVVMLSPSWLACAQRLRARLHFRAGGVIMVVTMIITTNAE